MSPTDLRPNEIEIDSTKDGQYPQQFEIKLIRSQLRIRHQQQWLI